MRNAFAQEITALADREERLVLLSGDIGNKLFDEFKEKHPARFYNCGVAEANMASVAAGLAMSGLRPVTYTIAAFNTVRCLEQIRVDVSYHNLPVVIVGVGGGLSYAELGGTHHSCEDVGFMRLLPNMTVMCPCDAVETRLALRAALKADGPVYIRLGKKGEPKVHDWEPAFAIGKSLELAPGDQACILCTGTIAPEAVAAAKILAGRGISARVVHFPTVKPLDTAELEAITARFPLIATVEEHSLIGGLGAAVGEWLLDRGGPVPRLVRFGTRDEFLHVSADQEHARAEFGITAGPIAARVEEAFRRTAGVRAR